MAKCYNLVMKCPVYNQDMKTVRWELTNNFKIAEFYTEYNKDTYECKTEDVWVTTEIPLSIKSEFVAKS